MIKENVIIKKDTEENWNKAKNFIPKDGEIIEYVNAGIKIGDGKTKIIDLPFVSRNSYFIDDTTLVIENRNIKFLED